LIVNAITTTKLAAVATCCNSCSYDKIFNLWIHCNTWTIQFLGGFT